MDKKNNSRTENRYKNNEKKWVKMPKKIILPEQIVNFLDKRVSENPPKFKYNRKLAVFFLFQVYKQTLSKFDNESFETYVKLCADILKKYCGKYNLYFDYFKENEILESLTHVKNAKMSECTKYRFSAEIRIFFENSPVKVSVIDLIDRKLSNKIWDERDISQALDKQCVHLTKWLNEKLKINYHEAAEVIENGNYSIFNKISTATRIASIAAGNFYASRKKETDNRLHTNFTSLCADFRPFIRYDGEDLVNYDIKNSQPYFLIVIVEMMKGLLAEEKPHSLLVNTDKYYKPNNIINKIIKTIYNNQYISLMMHNIEETLCSSEFFEEYSKLKNWIIDGEFYENLGAVLYPTIPTQSLWERRFKKVIGKDTKGNDIVKTESKYYNLTEKRKMVKDAVFVILFGSVNERVKGDDIKLFEKHFPHFSKLLKILKMQNQNQLALLLQQVESATMIDFVTKEIAKLHPEMPMLTVHDSVAIPRSWSLKVNLPELIQSLVTEFTGLTPGVDTDYYCPKCQAS